MYVKFVKVLHFDDAAGTLPPSGSLHHIFTSLGCTNAILPNLHTLHWLSPYRMLDMDYFVHPQISSLKIVLPEFPESLLHIARFRQAMSIMCNLTKLHVVFKSKDSLLLWDVDVDFIKRRLEFLRRLKYSID
jgi:hypothetical protein